MRWLKDLLAFVFEPPPTGNGYITLIDRPAPEVIVDPETRAPRFF